MKTLVLGALVAGGVAAQLTTIVNTINPGTTVSLFSHRYTNL